MLTYLTVVVLEFLFAIAPIELKPQHSSPEISSGFFFFAIWYRFS